MSHRKSSRPQPPWNRGTAGFTLIELLLVISILTMLISLLLPSLGSAKEQGRRAQCSSGMRQMMIAVVSYTDDHADRMPAFYHTSYSTPPADDWLMGRDTNVLTCVGKGSVFRYAPDKGLYRCPSLPRGVYQSGVGSNGGFDYAFFIAFAGTLMAKIPVDAEFTLADGRKVSYPVPILCEEDPAAQINNFSPEPGHCAWDEQGKWHGGGSFYATRDTSVHHFNVTGPTPAAYWSARKPNGASITLDHWWGVNNYNSWGNY